MASSKKAKVQVPQEIKVLTADELFGVLRILLAHKIYFTLANPSYGQMALHVIFTHVPIVRELLPEYFPKKNLVQHGQTFYFKLSGAPDKIVDKLKA